MLIPSTSWNAGRCAGWSAAASEFAGRGLVRVALDGPALYPDAARARSVLRDARGGVDVLFAPHPEVGRDPAAPAGGALGLASPRPEECERALLTAAAAATAAADAGCGLVVLRVGGPADVALDGPSFAERLARGDDRAALRADVAAHRDGLAAHRHRFLDALCRALHALCRRFPDHTFALETPRATGALPDVEDVRLVREELPGRRLAYWHDAGAAARRDALGAEPAAAWLESLGTVTAGVTLADWSPAGGRLPPGTGVVDWAALRGQLAAGMLRVLALEPEFPPAFFDEAVRQTRALGLD